MNPVAVVDLVAFLAVLTALVILWRGWERALERDAKLLLAGLLGLRLFHGLSNVLEWGGITRALDPVEDYIEILTPMLWVFFFYAVLKAVEIPERVRAEEALRKRTEEIELLYQASRQLGRTLDMDTIYGHLSDIVSEIMDCDSLVVSSFDSKDRFIRCAYAVIEGHPQDIDQIPPLPLNIEGRGTQSVAIHTGNSLLIRDYQARLQTSRKAYYVSDRGGVVDHDQAPDDAGVTRSGLVVPLKLEGQVVGVIQVGSYRLDAYTEDDLRILESLAQQIAVAGSNALLYRQAQDEIVRRRQAEEERELLLTQSRGQAQQLVEVMNTVPEGVLLLDARGQVLLANQVAEGDLTVLADAKAGDILRPGSGRALTHLGDRPLVELLTSPPARGSWHEVKAAGRTFEVTARPMEPTLRPAVDGRLPSGDGPEPENWVLVIRDVTQERQNERRIQQQGRLAAVGQLAAGNAHDFNNIMAVVVLYTQMELSTPDIPTQLHERLQTILQQANLATDLIQQILDFSRRAVLERRPMDLAPFLKEIVKLLERTVPESIKLQLTHGRDEYTVNADPTRMQQVIMNLAVNARDAMLPEGGGQLDTELDRLQVATHQEPPLPEMEAGEWVRITVTDSGSGIPAEVLPHIFEPFYTTKEAGKGTGLGLAQVYGIVKQHEGHIDVTTKIGEGTTFTIYVPSLLENQPEAVERETGTLARGQGETVLMVEDNADLRKALVAMLEQLDYRVLEAADGHEALDVLAQHAGEVSLVLSDLVMPDMGGAALFHAMRQRGLTLPVVMLSGHPMEKEMESLREQGLAGWMLKPPNMARLSRLLAQALDK